MFYMGRLGGVGRRVRDEAFEELMASINVEFAVRREMKVARRRAGLTQRELARRMRTTQAVIARLELGRRLPSFAVLRRMAEVTGSRLVVRLDAVRRLEGDGTGDSLRE